MADQLYPLLLKPALHTRVWGGHKLETVLGKTLPTSEPYGESWEMHDSAVIENGPLAGLTVHQALDQLGVALVGNNYDPAQGMPLLLKFLDAADWLSVQVHPDDAQAAELEGEPRGKTEAWIVLEADPGAQLVIGVKPGASTDDLRRAVEAGKLEDWLVYQPVSKGDVLFISAGTVHAIGPGLLIYEIQQSSDTTYRFYDWNRMGLDGKPRQLHVDKCLAVSKTHAIPAITRIASSGAEVTVIDSPYFKTMLYRLGGDSPQSVALNTGGKFQIITCVDGTLEIRAGTSHITLEKGRTALLPAGLGSYALSAKRSAQILRSWPGDGD
ncbi:MAG: class I mannose-6-phosphate isomerase [Anaerolineae bacterium]|nr:class I mannose-6-phosphate isomerase [Anaerolineae bacterium]